MAIQVDSIEFTPEQVVITYSESSDTRFQQGTLAIRRQLLVARGTTDRPKPQDDGIERAVDAIKLLLRDALDAWERASPVTPVPRFDEIERRRMHDEEGEDATARRNWEAIERQTGVRSEAKGVDSGGAPAGS